MPYKISGTLSDAARIIIIKESDWSIESNTTESVGAYEIGSLEAGAKLVAGRKSDGESLGYGSITPEEYSTGGDRGIFGGGYDISSTYTDLVEYITISTPGDSIDFGNLTVARSHLTACSNGANNRGVFAGGSSGNYTTSKNIIDYITISSPGNATNFGDLINKKFSLSGTSNGTNDRGIFAGGHMNLSPYAVNVISYITISSTGNAINFGDLTGLRYELSATSNGTNDRGIFVGGASQNTIDYVTISTPGNATDFGDLTVIRGSLGACSNGTNDRGVFGGGGTSNIIDYVTISSAGNATDFGDLTVSRRLLPACSNGENNTGVFGTGSGEYFTVDYITISALGDATDFGNLVGGGTMAAAGLSNA